MDNSWMDDVHPVLTRPVYGVSCRGRAASLLGQATRAMRDYLKQNSVARFRPYDVQDVLEPLVCSHHQKMSAEQVNKHKAPPKKNTDLNYDCMRSTFMLLHSEHCLVEAYYLKSKQACMQRDLSDFGEFRNQFFCFYFLFVNIFTLGTINSKKNMSFFTKRAKHLKEASSSNQ